MTPEEGSQSSEEILGIDKNCTDVPSTSNDTQIRVKNVSELNENEAEASSSTPVKRKLPSWMFSSKSPNLSVSKKRKEQPVTDQQPESSVSPSSSHQEEKCDSPVDKENDVNTARVVSNAESTEDAEEGNSIQANGEVEDGESEENNETDTNPDTEAISGSDVVTASTSSGQSTSLVTIKTEADSEAVGHITPTSPKDIKPAVKVEKEEATSSTTRVSCKFGIRCYRQNPLHRREEAHPGDTDYRRPNFPAPPDNTPDCPFGDSCYRRNPVHFQQFKHPPSTDFEQNYKNYKMRLRERKPANTNPNSSYSDLEDDDDYDLNDPFIDDHSTEEFLPGDDEDDDEDDL